MENKIVCVCVCVCVCACVCVRVCGNGHQTELSHFHNCTPKLIIIEVLVTHCVSVHRNVIFRYDDHYRLIYR